MASGDSLFTFDASAGHPPTVSFAALTRRNNHFCIGFDASVGENMDFESVLARQYSSGGITLTLGWMAATATTGAVVWSAQWERQEDEGTDLDADSFAATVSSAAVSAPATAGALQYTTIAFTDGAQLDSLADGEGFRIRITRVPTATGDTMAGDAQLRWLYGQET